MPTDRGGDSRLTDERLAAEIELLGRVIGVAADHDDPLTEAEIDEALGPPDDDGENEDN